MNESRRTVRWPVKAWWWFHVTLITLWCLPLSPPAVRSGRVSGGPVDAFLSANDQYVRGGLLRYYIEPTGMWQFWDMFAPDPMRSDTYVEGVIQFQDGSIKTVEFPRMAKLPLAQRYVKERFRKYIERGNNPDYQYLWPAIAQWLAAQSFTDPNNPPVAVNLQRQTRIVPPPTPSLDVNRPFTTEMFHPHMVDQDQLFRDKGWKR